MTDLILDFMRCLRQLCSVILLVGCSSLSAQSSVEARYDEAVQAFRQGDNDSVIKLLEPVLRSEETKGAELGRVEALLGASYRATGQYHSALTAYEKAVILLKDDPSAISNYEVSLRELGDFDREMGDISSAQRLEEKSLQLAQKNQDHAMIARACQGLTELFLGRGNLSKAEHFLMIASQEARLTNEFDQDDRAYLAQLQGWDAVRKGDAQGAINDYQQAIDLFTGRYGENFALTGWGYILLADAYELQGLRDHALKSAQKGMNILERTAGIHDPRYAGAEIRYAVLLDKTGQHQLASKLKDEGEATIREVHQSQCVGCTIGVAAFR